MSTPVKSYDQSTRDTALEGAQGHERGTMKEQTGTGMTSGGTMGPGGYGSIILTLKSAHNLMDKSWIGKSDPYCTVRIADAEISTHHVKNAGESCTWDESFRFNNVAPTDTLEIHVYDHNRMLKDAHMGEGRLNLRQVFDQQQFETRVPLTTRTGTKDAGEVWLTMRKEDVQGMTGMQKGYTQEQYTTTGGQREGKRTTQGEGAVCGTETFSVVEDRPRVVERVTQVLEHRPVEREFVKETRMVGERPMPAGPAEHLGTTEAMVSETQPGSACEVLAGAEGEMRAKPGYQQGTNREEQTRYEA